ncbi:MAG: amidohydrolase family protein [Actinomycetota bacterium]
MRTLYRASRVHTLSHPQTGEWVLIDERHVQRVGSGDPPEADRVVDLPGTTILPGFIDTHVHLTRTGSALANRDVEAAASVRELLTIASERASEGEGPVVLLGFDESRWEDPTHPVLVELDAVTSRPLMIHRADGHLALANSAALEAAGIRSDQEGVERDADGIPTGRVTRDAVERLGRWASASVQDNEIQELQLRAAALGASNGVTAAHEMSMPHWLGLRDLQVFLGHRDRLPMDVVPVVATMDIPQIMDLGLPAIGGDLPLDGSIGARTAAVTAPYADSDGNGSTYHADDELESFFHAGHMAGLQVGAHAIGDRAIEQALTVWERVYAALDSRERRHFRARRHRVEHFEMASTSQIERAAMLGLAVSVQPTFDRYWGQPGGLYDAALGWDRAAAMNPFRTMIDRGIEVGAGSDTPITPFDPMLSIAACEAHHDAAQRLSRIEAIRVHTSGGARVGHQEDKKGVLGPGMHADMAAYDTDPMTVDSVEGLRPILTISLGREVFAR